MGRKVGARIREVLEIVEAGAVTKDQILCRMTQPVSRDNLGTYCSRAVDMGLLAADSRTSPARYSVVPGWRAKADRQTRQPAPCVNSVFALGAA